MRVPLGDLDPIGIALLGEEQLAVVGELLLPGVARDEREEVSRPAVGLRAQNTAEALSLLGF